MTIRNHRVPGSKSAWAAGCGLVALLMLLVSAWPRGTPTASGDVREEPRRETFLSGGARSEIILREMNEVLKRIDARLERFERALQETQQQQPADRQPADGNGDRPSADGNGERQPALEQDAPRPPAPRVEAADDRNQ